MSNHQTTAKERETGEIVEVHCFDDYFGKHKYGYQVGENIYTEDEFKARFVS